MVMNVNNFCRCWLGVMLLGLLWGCSALTYDKLMPKGYTPSFRNGLNANVEVAVGPRECVYSGSFALTSEAFKKALLQTAGKALSDSYENQKYTLLVKNINCCMENNNVSRTPCTGKSYWAVRDHSSGHIIWQQYIEETGIGTFHIDGGKRIKEAITNSAKQTIEAGLTALSQADLTAAEKEVSRLAERWRAQRTVERFNNLYEYLFYSANKRIQRDRDGYRIDFYGELLAAPSKQNVVGLLGDPDNTLAGSGSNQTFEWRFVEKGKEIAYRISFFQDQMSGGTIRRQE